jgi:hypothetical protein
MRPETYGPLSTTGAVTERPLAGLRNVTRVPHGSVRWATPTSDLVRTWPHAVCWPMNPGPYQLMLGSWCHGFLWTTPGFGAGCGTRGRVGTELPCPRASNVESGPSRLAERCAGSSDGIDVAGEPAGRANDTARMDAGSMVRAELGALEPAGSGTATRALAAMSAAIATMNLVRTMPRQAT